MPVDRDAFLRNWIVSVCSELQESILINLTACNLNLPGSPQNTAASSSSDLLPTLEEISTWLLSSDSSLWTSAFYRLAHIFSPDEPNLWPSSFELQQSGLVTSLICYFTETCLRKKRLRAFIKVFLGKRAAPRLAPLLPSPDPEFSQRSKLVDDDFHNLSQLNFQADTSDEDEEDEPLLNLCISRVKAFSSLIRCLLHALAQEEQFLVNASPSLVTQSSANVQLNECLRSFSLLDVERKPRFVAPLVGTLRVELVCCQVGMDQEKTGPSSARKWDGKRISAPAPIVVRISALSTVCQLEKLLREHLSGSSCRRSIASHAFWLTESSSHLASDDHSEPSTSSGHSRVAQQRNSQTTGGALQRGLRSLLHRKSTSRQQEVPNSSSRTASSSQRQLRKRSTPNEPTSVSFT
ncbi:Ubiquitin-protein ligase [Cichlidogyrus casuarinus]|uniref:Ubiquitin-protein ligase n=1 Tax=Cichlidogyrus casuarinus TaxID=1844966 RepID=A0ABD2QFH9_9PLAT